MGSFSLCVMISCFNLPIAEAFSVTARCGALSLQSRVYKRMRIQLRKLASNGSELPWS